MIEPWLQQEGESGKAYKHFRVFLEMGETRTIKDAAKLIGVSHQNLRNNFSSKYRWADRARAYDERPRIANMEGRIAAAFAAGRDSEIAKMREDEFKKAALLDELLHSASAKLLIATKSLEPGDIKAANIPAFLSAVAKIATALTNSQAALTGVDDILQDMEERSA